MAHSQWERESPMDTSSYMSQLLWLWLDPFLKQNYERAKQQRRAQATAVDGGDDADDLRPLAADDVPPLPRGSTSAELVARYAAARAILGPRAPPVNTFALVSLCCCHVIAAYSSLSY